MIENSAYFQIFGIVNNAVKTLQMKCFYVFQITPLGLSLDAKLSKPSLFGPSPHSPATLGW